MATIPSVDDLALFTSAELEDQLRQAQADHDAALREQAALYDKLEAEIARLKADPRKLTAELIIRDGDGKKVERFQTPAPVETPALSASLTTLQRQALKGSLVQRATRSVSEAQAKRAEARRAIQREQEDHVRVHRRYAYAIEQRKERERAASGREVSAMKHARQNTTPRSMMERLGLDAFGAGS